ncbi:alpha/beta hydrolase [Pseudonocardia kujensis]|uniref:alpha/beta fold hydrolase n=1 Tax=Pseudonocardia kujensis TaxID=1128675 RepID=UPI001E3C2E2E|nr:alpha/beta hydrolase [Pseudonocardia kujensis]MCE0763319.1 alpha/beta hydrolase [Pseudonocardia kujensis]
MTQQSSPAGVMATTSGAVESSDGTPIEYLRVGSGPPVVVCHGSFAVAEDWLPFARELGATHTVWLYDRRGRGPGPRTEPAPAVDAEVDDLAAVVARAGTAAALLGHSFGGGCALAYAGRDGFPGPVVLYEPRHSITGPVSAGRIPEIRRLLATHGPEAAVRAILATVVGLPEEDIAAFAGSPLWGRMLQTVHAFPDELRLLDSLAWRPGDLAGARGPTWLLVGETSPVLPADREGALGGVLPGLRRVVLPGQGHFAYLSAPAALAQTVRECLAASDAPLPRAGS